MAANETLARHPRILAFLRHVDDCFESKKTRMYLRVYNYKLGY